MSTDYVPNRPISFDKIMTFNHNGVKVHEINKDGNVCLTDGTNFLWVAPRADIGTYRTVNGNLEFMYENPYEGVIFTRYGGNNPEKIILAIEDFFNVRLVTEYEDEYANIVTPKGVV